MPTRPGRASDDPARQRARLRVLVVDDHPVVREGLRHLIEDEPDLCVCDECGDATAALELVGRSRPDVALVDLTLGDEPGLELVRALSRQHPQVRVLVFSMHDEMLYAERCLRAGALGYVMKRGPACELVAAIRHVAAGRTHVSAEVADRLIGRATGRRTAAASNDPAIALTDRERQVFELIGHGLATREIAARLYVSVKTVEAHQAHIREKLGARSGREVIRMAVNWVER